MRACLPLFFSLALASSVCANDIRPLVGFAPGGTSSKAVAPFIGPLARISGNRVTPMYMEGSGGLKAAEYLSRRPPGLHTLLFMSSTSTLRVGPELGLVPVALIARYDYVAARLAPGTLADHIEQARSDKTYQNVATPGAGTMPHLFMARLYRQAGVPLNHIPYAGGAPAVMAILASDVPLVATPEPDVVGNDRLHIIARTGKGLPVGGWMGIYAPPGTSEVEVAQAESWFRAIVPETKEMLEKVGFRPVFGAGKEFGAIHQASRHEWLPELDREGIKF